MNPLQQEIFYQQFGNQPRAQKPYHQRKTYLCYQLTQHGGSMTYTVCLQNKKNRHAEICFIDNIKARQLDSSQRYEITCYMTWSPCPTCAEELVAFVENHPHIRLRLFASQFEDCWRQFVDHQGESFQPWNKLRQYSESITRRLQRILKHSQNNLENDFGNLQI